MQDKNTPVSIIAEQANWYQVILNNGIKGWVAKQLVNTTTVPKITLQKTGRVLYASKIRKSPKILVDNVIEVLYPGTMVCIIDAKTDWYSVIYNEDKSGWVAQELVTTTVATTTNVATTSSIISLHVASSTILESITSEEINRIWLELINPLRKAKGLREVSVDQRLVETASTWANYLGQTNKMTHDRPDGKTMHQWIKDQDIAFSERYSVKGWKTNYFTENLGYRLGVKPTTESIKSALNSILQSYLNEGSNGVHYKSVYHPDWNSVGVGWYAVKDNKGTYKICFVFHYGSLQK